jgi:hypothetical protein
VASKTRTSPSKLSHDSTLPSSLLREGKLRGNGRRAVVVPKRHETTQESMAEGVRSAAAHVARILVVMRNAGIPSKTRSGSRPTLSGGHHPDTSQAPLRATGPGPRKRVSTG